MKTRMIISVCALTAAFGFACCEKKTPNIAPEPDTDVNTTVDAVWMLQSITDIDMIVSYTGEDQFRPTSYTDLEVASNGTVMGQRELVNPADPFLTMAFNNTRCADGKLRDGTVYLFYGPNPVRWPKQTPNSKYIREYGFAGRFYLQNYKINEWLIETSNGDEADLMNTLDSPDYDPATTNITWDVSGKFLFTPPNGSTSQPMMCHVWLTKTLENTKTCLPNKNQPINWSRAVISYHGRMIGITGDGKSFEMTISSKDKFIRDWNVTPDGIAEVDLDASGKPQAHKEEYHPFVKGIATFIPEGKYPRQIYIGNEGQGSLAPQTDNSGVVLIKGNSYRVDFRK